MRTEFRDLFDKVLPDNLGAWEVAALSAMRDAILCAENGNFGGAWSYVAEANDYLECLKEGMPTP